MSKIKRKNIRKKSIFDFNNIDENLSSEKIKTIESLYKHYHKKCWLYKFGYKYFKKIDLTLKISSTGIIACGAIIGGITFNPIILGSITGIGIIIKTFQDIKNYKKKIEMCKFAFITYEKVLIDLRSNLRGILFDYKSFIDEIKMVDEIIIEICPPIDKFNKKYNLIFTKEL